MQLKNLPHSIAVGEAHDEDGIYALLMEIVGRGLVTFCSTEPITDIVCSGKILCTASVEGAADFPPMSPRKMAQELESFVEEAHYCTPPNPSSSFIKGWEIRKIGSRDGKSTVIALAVWVPRVPLNLIQEKVVDLPMIPGLLRP